MDSSAFWATFPQDPRSRDNEHLRARDQDRDSVISLLGDAYAEGRLDHTEFDERTTQASRIRVLGEIPPIVHDLVSNAPASLSASDLRVEALRRYRADRRNSIPYLAPALICWIIWAAVLISGHGTPFPWPIFVTFATGALPAVRLWVNPEEHIRARMRRIEKRQARELPNS